MINVITDERRDQKKFPKLMQSTLTGIIVLFERNNCGVVVKGDENEKTGNISNSWGMENFIDYNEPITLQNA